MNHQSSRSRNQARLRWLNRIILLGSALAVPLYFVYKFHDGSYGKLDELPDLFDRIKTPYVLEVDEVRYFHYFKGMPEEGHKFVLVTTQISARMKIGYPIGSRCFRLKDSEDQLHYPLTHSPLFIDIGADEFRLDRDDSVQGELLFAIPTDRSAERLLFERYQE
jgi:hypothetical protein